MLNIIKHYLQEENYFVCLYKSFIYFYKYLEILKFTDKLISIKFDKFVINVSGDNFCVKKMEKHELLISGNIMKVEKTYV